MPGSVYEYYVGHVVNINIKIITNQSNST